MATQRTAATICVQRGQYASQPTFVPASRSCSLLLTRLFRTCVLHTCAFPTCLLLTCLFLACPGLGSDAIAQQSRSIDELVEMLGSDDRDSRRDATHELVGFGPDAVQALDGLIAALEDRDNQIFHDACQALAHLGPKAAPALDALIEAMESRDEQRRFRTAHAIGSIGTAALPAMRERLDSDRESIREVAVRAIGEMGEQAADVAPELTGRLADRAETVRICAIQSLTRLGPAAVDTLTQALRHEEVTIRRGAALALSGLGSKAGAALAELQRLGAEDADTDVRAAAVASLGRVAPADPEIIPSLLQAMEDEQAAVRRAAVESWISTSPRIHEQATDALVEVLRSGNPARRPDVLLTLNRFGARAVTATPVLLELLTQSPDSTELTTTIGQIGKPALESTYSALREQKISPAEVARIIQGMPATVKRSIARKIDDQSPIVRQLAATTIGDLTPFPGDGLVILTQGLQDPAEPVRKATAESARKVGGKVGDKVSSLAPVLAESLSKESIPETRAVMLHALAAVVPADGQTVLMDALAENIDHSSQLVKQAVLEELAALETLPTRFLEPLRDLLTDSNASVRSLAATAVAGIEGDRDPVVALLLPMLEDANVEVQQRAMRSLAKLGDAALPAIEPIQRQLDADSQETQVAAIEALTQLGKRSQAALPKIETLAMHGSESVRKSAFTSVRRIAAQPDDAVRILLNGLKDQEWTIRRTAALELGELEERAAAAVPALFEMMRSDEESDVARGALREIGTANKDALPVIMEILRDRDSGRRRRYYALYILREMGGKARSVVEELKTLRKESDGSLDDHFERAIKSIED